MLPKTPGSNRSGRRIEEGQWEGKRVRYFTDHVIVKFKAPPKGSDRTARSLSDDIARQLPGGRIKRYPRATGRALVAFDPKENVFDVVKRLSSDDSLVYVELDVVDSAQIAPNDTRYGDQWSHGIVDSEDAWERDRKSVV